MPTTEDERYARVPDSHRVSTLLCPHFQRQLLEQRQRQRRQVPPGVRQNQLHLFSTSNNPRSAFAAGLHGYDGPLNSEDPDCLDDEALATTANERVTSNVITVKAAPQTNKQNATNAHNSTARRSQKRCFC